MPRRPRIARLEVNGIKIDVYDRETLLTLLEMLGNDKLRRFDKAHKERKEHKAIKAGREDKRVFFPRVLGKKDPSLKVGGQLPSFAESNPWIKVLSKKRLRVTRYDS